MISVVSGFLVPPTRVARVGGRRTSLLAALALLTFPPIAVPQSAAPPFELVQPDLFSAPGGQPNAWADFDNDGDLDEFVGFRGRPNRLYRQTNGRFDDVAAAVGIADNVETRVAAWGDFDGDGNIDLYVGFVGGTTPNKLYRNDGDGRHFTDVAAQYGVNLTGITRQASWIDYDYDNDGDLDLFIAFRDKPNRLFRNDGGHFTGVTEESGVGDPRKTVGAVWFDIDGDGDLDLFVANQESDANGLFRNDNGHFVDVAKEWGVDAAGRPAAFGGVGPAVADFDGDGRLDLFVANYGPSALYRNDRGRRFLDVSKAAGVFFEQHATTPAWGDYDNDGALDLSLTNNDAGGGHYRFRNRLPAAQARQSLSVMVLDAHGRFTKAGSEVRVYKAGTRQLIASALVDTGSGYCSQNVMPVHVATATAPRVDVEVTTMSKAGRKTTKHTGIDPTKAPQPLVIRTP